MERTDKVRAALLKCLGSEDPGKAIVDLQGFTPEDWDRLVQKSANHDVAPLLYRCLKRIGPEAGAPEKVLLRLRRIYQANTARNLRTDHELAAVLKRLKTDGVDAVVLKGAHLVRIVYGDIGLRPMYDVDILVRKPDLPKARDTLLGMGYLHPEFTENIPKHLHHFSKPGSLPVEVHWTLASETEPLTIDIEGLWKRATLAKIGGAEALLLSPEDLFLHLCLHAAHTHGFVLGLKPFCDITQTIRHYEDRMDWEQALSLARRWGAKKSVFSMLYLARELLGTDVPDEVMEGFDSSGFDGEIAAIAKEQILSVEDDSRRTAALFKQFVRLWGRNGLIKKARLLLRILFLPPEQMRSKYQSNRLLWCYMMRPFDLFIRYFPLTRWIFKSEKRTDRQALSLLNRMENADVIKSWIESDFRRS